MLVLFSLASDTLNLMYPIWYFIFAVVGFAGVVTLLLPSFYRTICCFRPQNLKTRYNADWSIVTGGSSGIGKAIVEKLCQQNINVIILAVDDEVLKNTAAELTAKYPNVEIISVGADLSKTGYMELLEKQTKNKDIKLLFCNAGFMLSGFFASTHINAAKANSAVNVGCHLELTHKYLNQMLKSNSTKNGKRGAIFFTSSPAWMLPSPTAAMYAGTKACRLNFNFVICISKKYLVNEWKTMFIRGTHFFFIFYFIVLLC